LAVRDAVAGRNLRDRSCCRTVGYWWHQVIHSAAVDHQQQVGASSSQSGAAQKWQLLRVCSGSGGRAGAGAAAAEPDCGVRLGHRQHRCCSRSPSASRCSWLRCPAMTSWSDLISLIADAAHEVCKRLLTVSAGTSGVMHSSILRLLHCNQRNVLPSGLCAREAFRCID